MIITVLNENAVYKRGFMAEHGMSVLIEFEGKKILFDTAQTGVFMDTAQKMNADLSNLDAIVISHGHYDHTGGLEFFAEEYPMPPVYIRDAAFEDKYSRKENMPDLRDIGIPWRNLDVRKKIERALIYAEEQQEIFPNVYLLGKIPYTTEFEGISRGLKVSRNGEILEDAMEDEQMLIIRSEKGIHVFLGCAHPGVINALRHVEQHFPGEHIFSLYAGMHLIGVKKDKMKFILDELEKREIDLIMPVHCTGQEAIAALRGRFAEKCMMIETGETVAV